ncbi:MAG TPA: serine hydrolase [Patescibacteria group bacterium]|nr:serine hydrolase [Patescibacteria group bacterium]
MKDQRWCIQKTGLFCLLGFVLLAQPLFALAEESQSFNPNFIISDDELQNYRSMSRTDIQSFLESQNSPLAEHWTKDLDNKRQKAADIIYQAAQTHKINPQYLLVKLQKEQSLITDPDPKQSQFDWATGYGVCDNCSTSDPEVAKHRGFATQVDSAAGIMRWYYDHYLLETWIKKANSIYVIDGQTVSPATAATAFLYTYTPHILGNKNFWKLWTTWFSQTYPDGSLLQANESPDIYLIANGQKRLITNLSVFLSRFDPKMVIRVRSEVLTSFPAGPDLSFPNYSLLKVAGNYYLIDGDYARPFANSSLIQKFGYHPDEIIVADSTDLQNYKIGKTIENTTADIAGRLVRLGKNGPLYYLKDNAYQEISDPQIAAINYPGLKATIVTSQELSNYQPGSAALFKDGTLVGQRGGSKIYVVENGKLRHLTSEDTFNQLGYQWSNVIWTDAITFQNHRLGSPLSSGRQLAATEIKPETLKTAPVQVSQLPDPSAETGKMYKIPEAQAAFVGPTFSTPVDTYLIADYQTGEILAGKNIDVKRPMASLAKVMTAYRLLKEGLDLNDSSVYDPAKHQASYHYAFKISAGEIFRHSDLMSALLVSSFNTAARFLVKAIEPDENAFIQRMNEQAADWNLVNTTFVDTDGYNLGNLTTARDYLELYRLANKNKILGFYLGTQEYTYQEIKDLDGYQTHHDYHTNFLTKETGLNFEILTSKTGYLNEAGACLVMTIRRPQDNRIFFILTLANPDYSSRFTEPKKIAQWAVNNF